MRTDVTRSVGVLLRAWLAAPLAPAPGDTVDPELDPPGLGCPALLAPEPLELEPAAEPLAPADPDADGDAIDDIGPPLVSVPVTWTLWLTWLFRSTDADAAERRYSSLSALAIDEPLAEAAPPALAPPDAEPLAPPDAEPLALPEAGAEPLPARAPLAAAPDDAPDAGVVSTSVNLNIAVDALAAAPVALDSRSRHPVIVTVCACVSA